MLAARLPSQPLPEPLRAADIPSFAHYSVVTRLPDIARRTLAENDFTGETARAIQALIDEIPNGTVRPVDLGSRPCPDDWDAWIAPYVGMNWLEIPWFFAEEYFYLRILEATGYFGNGPSRLRDPYAGQKRLGLTSTRARLRALAVQVSHMLHRLDEPGSDPRGDLARLILEDLWGNQNDLSMWPVLEDGEGAAAAHAEEPAQQAAAEHAAQERILDNHLAEALSYLGALDPAAVRIDILLDNAGYELATDLALADYLLASGQAAEVALHAKCYPVFVSDALDTDIHDTIEYLLHEGSPATREMALRLRRRLVDGSLRMEKDGFWTSPLPAWEMPPALREALAPAALMIVKGDANYRRLLGDRHWPYHMPFAAVVDYLPCAVLALRTLKSEVLTGVSNGRVPRDDPEWMVNGRWGVVQFAPPARE